MNTILAIYYLALVCIYLSAMFVTALAVVVVMKLYDWLRARYLSWRGRRNERQLSAEIAMRRGVRKRWLRVNAVPQPDERSSIHRFNREAGR